MRPLAIELAFDVDSSERLARVWSRLSVLYGGPKDSELGVRPHITLALFRSGEPNNAPDVVKSFGRNVAAFRLNLSIADRFPTDEGVIFLRPEPTADLIRTHATLYELLDEDRRLVHPYYQPGAWQPHFTMAINVPEFAMAAGLAMCRDPDVLGEVRVTRIQVVRYRPATEIAGIALESHDD